MAGDHPEDNHQGHHPGNVSGLPVQPGTLVTSESHEASPKQGLFCCARFLRYGLAAGRVLAALACSAARRVDDGGHDRCSR